jgi:peptidoglycan/xylan/chitin deacetylase (PgdA/CDA1 family)
LALTPLGRMLFPAVTTTGDLRSVALTFDDGPHPVATPKLLDVLDSVSARATFFLVGEQVQRAPDVAQEIVRRGHEIACHGYVHRNHLARPPIETRDDIVRSRELIESVCSVTVSHFRPPYGVFNLASWRTCRTLGLAPVLWSRWTRDWEERASVQSIVSGATTGLVGGEIVLLHDADTYSAPASHDDTIAAVPEIVEHIHAMGLRAVGLGEALTVPA